MKPSEDARHGEENQIARADDFRNADVRVHIEIR
tara:strand:+ start:394 stop:495 length:102 start_codon:yes stop_codon:yes gene_type:complete